MIKSIPCEKCGNDFWETFGDTADCTKCYGPEKAKFLKEQENEPVQT